LSAAKQRSDATTTTTTATATTTTTTAAPRSARRNPTEFAILGFLAEAPMSGYDIKQEVEQRLGTFWTESYGNIYPMLRRLRTRKLVSMRLVAGRRGPSRRKLYTITDAGRNALARWFETPVAPLRPRNEFLLRVFFGRHAPAGVLAHDLRGFAAKATQTLQHLRSVRARLSAEDELPDRVYWESVIDYGEQVFATLASWSAEVADRLGEPPSAA
jgi:DNA-binding PadR family transcriptional regulator